MVNSVLGVIGGSGINELAGLTDVEVVDVDTPYGPTSSAVVRGRLGSTTLLFIARHGKGHTIAPHEIPFRANVCALRLLGATHVLSISAVGSLQDAIAPGDVVVVDQYIDLTRRRISTFFEGGLVGHVSMADPTCPVLGAALVSAAERTGARVHPGGTYVCIEGPQFSTRAESRLYRSWGASIIGMTAMPEAKLAREAGLPYANLALATDYDSWRPSEDAVSVHVILEVLAANAARAGCIVGELALDLPDPTTSPFVGALRDALITSPEHFTTEAQERLQWLLHPTERPPA
jgi:5'-methylthioadenosine phosphorylase